MGDDEYKGHVYEICSLVFYYIGKKGEERLHLWEMTKQQAFDVITYMNKLNKIDRKDDLLKVQIDNNLKTHNYLPEAYKVPF